MDRCKIMFIYHPVVHHPVVFKVHVNVQEGTFISQNFPPMDSIAIAASIDPRKDPTSPLRVS